MATMTLVIGAQFSLFFLLVQFMQRTLGFGAFESGIAFLPLSLAIALNSRLLRGSGLFRTLFFLPYVIPFVSGVLIWGSMLNLETGWEPQVSWEDGVRKTIQWYAENRERWLGRVDWLPYTAPTVKTG